MNEAELVLTESEAETVVDTCIEMFGLDALPRVQVTAVTPDLWCVHWDHQEAFVPPMTERAWRTWLEENVGDLDAEHLETSES